jgi:hypothetical protein
LDSHHKKHIAHKAFWSSVENDVEGKGAEPTEFLEITEDDLQNGKWYPKDCSLQVLPLDQTASNSDLIARFTRSFCFKQELLPEVYQEAGEFERRRGYGEI